LNRRILAVILIIAAVAAVGTSTAVLTGVITITPGAESLQLVGYTYANVTLNNVGSNSATLVKVDVESVPYNGYTPPVVTVYLKTPVVIGSGQVSTFSESFTGSGYNVTAHIVTERGHIFTWFMPYHPPQPHQELLIITGGGFGDTDAELDLKSSASTPFTLQSYTVKDANGNMWKNSSWGIPIPTSSSAPYASNWITPVTLTIGPGSGALYTGVAGAFDKYTAGSQYTIIIGTSNNQKFFFSVTRGLLTTFGST
jgi:hypothetical protein